MRILVTNDDGIDAQGLAELVAAVAPHGEVVVAAPDREYSGFGAAIGTIHEQRPEVRRASVPGASMAFAVNGPPALCVFLAIYGLFGAVPDLVVSGINPGANVGRAVYHSGTVGAAITARNGGITAIAFSQDAEFSALGQAEDEALRVQCWESARAVAGAVVGAIIESPPPPGSVLNVNIPNVGVAELAGWCWSPVGLAVPGGVVAAELEPRPGHEGAFVVKLTFGGSEHLDHDTDAAAVDNGLVSLSWLSRIAHEPIPGFDDRALRVALGSLQASHS